VSIGWKEEVAMDFNLLRSSLEQERTRLIQKLDQMKTRDYSTNESQGSWFGERDEQSTEANELRSHLSSEKNLREELAKVEHVLHKLDEGTYGLCDDCGQTIDPDRLQALPHANLCLNCKTLRERRS